MKTTSIIVLATGLTLAGASGAIAQTVEPKAYVDLNIGGRTQSVTIATSSTFTLFGESGAANSSSTAGKAVGPDGGVGFFLRKNLAIGVGVAVFTRSPTGTVSITTPDPIAFNSFTTVASSPTLTTKEFGTHFKVVYLLPVNDKMDVTIAGGPSFMRLSRDIATASVVNGAPQIAVETQTGSTLGVHGSVDVNYLFTRRLGAGIFVRYILAQVDLPAASGVSVGGFQAGLGLRVRF